LWHDWPFGDTLVLGRVFVLILDLLAGSNVHDRQHLTQDVLPKFEDDCLLSALIVNTVMAIVIA
jgi:hypothetical protein